MIINNVNLTPNLANLTQIDNKIAKKEQNYDEFSAYFDAYLNVFNETNDYQKIADTMQIDFAAGRIDDPSSVLLAQEKAFSSLSFTVQVTNKLIEAYREIMRMQL